MFLAVHHCILYRPGIQDYYRFKDFMSRNDLSIIKYIS